MLTGRRIRERQAAEQAGLSPPPPPSPTSISYQEHLAELGRVNKAHAVELAAARAKPAKGVPKAQLEELGRKLDEALAELEQVTKERDEALAELEQVTTPEEAPTGGPPPATTETQPEPAASAEPPPQQDPAPAPQPEASAAGKGGGQGRAASKSSPR